MQRIRVKNDDSAQARIIPAMVIILLFTASVLAFSSSSDSGAQKTISSSKKISIWASSSIEVSENNENSLSLTLILDDGMPLKGKHLTVFSNGTEFFSGDTNEKGVLTTPVFGPGFHRVQAFFAGDGDEFISSSSAFLNFSVGPESQERNFSGGFVGGGAPLALTVRTDKSRYELNETILISGFARVNQSDILLEILFNDSVLSSLSVTPSINGTYSYSLLNSFEEEGVYSIRAIHQNLSALARFTIFSNETEETEESYLNVSYGDLVQGNITIGEPVEWFRNITVTNHGNQSFKGSIDLKLPEDVSNVSVDDENVSGNLLVELSANETRSFSVYFFTNPVVLKIENFSSDLTDLLPPEAKNIKVFEEDSLVASYSNLRQADLNLSGVQKKIFVSHEGSLHYHNITVRIPFDSEEYDFFREFEGKRLNAKRETRLRDGFLEWNVEQLSSANATMEMGTRIRQLKASVGKPVEWELIRGNYTLVYETPEPMKNESFVEGFKRVLVFSNASVHYQNISAKTSIPGLSYTPKLYVLYDGERVDVSEDPDFNVSCLDSDSDGSYDEIEWVVPQLSNVTFDVDIDIINVQSFPLVGGNWSVRFNTTGIANLTIRPFNGTSWSNENNNSDLTFNSLYCGNESINHSWLNNSVFVEDYNCTELSIETSEVLTAGKHYLEFLFGQDRGTAFNDAGWPNASFDKCMNITISNAGSSTLTNFPAFINLTKQTDMLSDYSDLRFYDEPCSAGFDGNELDFEIENYTSSYAHIWTRIPSLGSSGKTISVYYKNSTAVSSGENASGVWVDYHAVWHLNEAPMGSAFDILDSTGVNHGNSTDMLSTQKVDGLSGNALEFADSNDVVYTPSTLMGNGSTISVWVKRDQLEDEIILGAYNDTKNYLRLESDGTTFNFQDNDGNAFYFYNSQYSTGTWYNLVLSRNTTHWTFYRNGEGINSTSGSAGLIVNALGQGYDGQQDPLDGVLEEVRLSNTQRSADWINQSYLMINNQSDFVTFGNETNRTSVLNVTLVWPSSSYFNDTSRYVNITFNATVSDDDDLVNCSLWHNISGWQENQTVNVTGTSNNTEFTIDNMTNVAFEWNIRCFDSTGQSAFAQFNRTVILNWTDDPQVTLNAPTDGSTESNPNNIVFNCSATDDTNLANISLYFNETNVLYEDGFDSIDLSSWTADPSWSNGMGEWNVSGGVLENNGSAGGIQVIYRGDRSWENYTYQALVKKEEDDPMGIVFYYNDSDNYWRYLTESGYMLVRGRVGGLWRNAGGWLNDQFAVDDTAQSTWYWFKVNLNGTHIRVKHWEQGTSEPEWEREIPDVQLTNGSIGVMGWSGGTYFDNLTVENGTRFTLNQTDSTVSGTEDSAQWTVNLSTGEHEWGCKAYDTEGNYGWGQNYSLTVVNDTQGPSCSIVSTSPANLTASSSGYYTVLINCTDVSNINESRVVLTRTISDNGSSSPPFHWSIRPPPHDLAQNYSGSEYNISSKILLADARGRNQWYDSLFSDNYSYAAMPKYTPLGTLNPYMTVTNGSGWSLFNYTAPVDVASAPSSLPISRGKLESEVKKDYNIQHGNSIVFKFWNLESMKGNQNYTACVFRNLNYSGSPSEQLKAYLCNSSYAPVASEMHQFMPTTSIWHMNDKSGDIVDLKNVANGSYNGVLYEQPAYLNTSIGFDGSDDYISFNATPYNSSEGMISGWFKPNTVSPAKQALVSYADFNSSNNSFEMGLKNDEFYLTLKGNGTTLLSFETIGQDLFEAGDWHYLTFAINGSGNKMFIDGANISVTYTTGDENTTSFLDQVLSADALEFGRVNANDSDSGYFNGSFDEFAFWPSRYSDEAIAGGYEAARVDPARKTESCLFINALEPSDISTPTYTSRNSSYTKQCFSSINGLLGPLKLTDEMYIYYTTIEESGSYDLRYVNGSTGANISFAETELAWKISDDGFNSTEQALTPDVWFSSRKDNDTFLLGVYAEDVHGNNYTNFSMFSDDIESANNPISSPSIDYLGQGRIAEDDSCHSSGTCGDYFLNGSYYDNMTIRIQIAIDGDNQGAVNHSLYLCNPDGSVNFTINSSFYSSDDSDMNVYFDTTQVPNGTYKMNVTAIADDNSSDVQSYLTSKNFTIQQQESASISFTGNTPANGNYSTNDWVFIETSTSGTLDRSAYLVFDDDLVGNWDFENVSGSTVYDNTDYENNGNLTNGAVQTLTGKRGAAAIFDGDDDHVIIPDQSEFDVGANFSVEAWVKEGNHSNGWAQIVNRDADLGFNLQHDTDNSDFELAVNTDLGRNYTYEEPVGGLYEDVWYHVVGTYDNESIRVYIDGNLRATENLTSNPATSNEPIYIGTRGENPLDRFFNGTIDEVRLWNRTLSLSEIQASYESHNNVLSRNFTGLAPGNYSYYACAIDEDGSESCTETRYYLVSASPNVTLNSPDATYINDTSRYVNITFNATATDDVGLVNCSLWHNISGWQENQTNPLTGKNNSTVFTINDLTNKTFIWNVKCFDNTGQSDWGNSNRTIILNWTDSESPTWSNNETNASSTTKTNETTYFNITLNDNVEGGHYIFSYYNGTAWTNETAQAWSAPEEIEVTKAIPSTRGQAFQWYWWFNDSNGNSNITDTWSIAIANSEPTHTTPILNSTNPSNLTDGNLTCYNQSTADPDDDSVKNIYNWYEGGISIVSLNMPFEGGSNSTYTKDYSVNSHAGITSGPTWNSTGGHDGFGAYEFSNSEGDYINSSASNVVLTGGSDFAISVWIKTETNHPVYGGSEGRIINFHQGTPSTAVSLYVEQNKIALLYYTGTSHIWVKNTQNYYDNNWHNLAVSFNSSSSSYSFYYDGVKVNETNHAFTSTLSDYNMMIGSYDGTQRYFNGTIDDLLIFNTSLSENQIKAIYENNTNLLLSDVIESGDVWSCDVTPNDGYVDGTTLESNNLTIWFTDYPNVTIISPQNGENLTGIGSKALEYTVTDNDGVDNCWYSKDGAANVTLDSCQNTTLSFTKGVHNITVYANDSTPLNYTSSDFVNFTVKETTSLISLSFEPSTQARGSNVTVSVRLMDQLGVSGLEDQNVSFNDTTNNTFIGHALTNSEGYASLVYQLPGSSSLGSHTINASFPGNDSVYYLSSSTTDSLTVVSRPNINSVIISDTEIGFKEFLYVQANVTNETELDDVLLYVTHPNETTLSYPMSLSGGLYEYNLTDLWTSGDYALYVFANNTGGISNQSATYNVSLNVKGTLDIQSDKDEYKNYDTVDLANKFDWALPSYDYRQVLNISNSGDTSVSDYPLSMELDTQSLISDGKMNDNCSDIQFATLSTIYEMPLTITNPYGSTQYNLTFPLTLTDSAILNHLNSESEIRLFETNQSAPYSASSSVDFWVDSVTSTSVEIWVRLDELPTSGKTLYLYYGNKSASSVSNYLGTFDEIIGEAGRVNISSSWTWVDFKYMNASGETPIVVASLNTLNEADEAFSRISHVNASGFNVTIQESISLDQSHGNETLGWIAVKNGTSILMGEKLQAGSVTGGDTSYEDISFDYEYSTAPAVISDIVTLNNATSVKTRLSDLTPSTDDDLSFLTGFKVFIEEADTSGGSGGMGPAGVHGDETIHWIAMPQGFYVAGATRWNVAIIEGSHSWQTRSLTGFSVTPSLIGKVMTEDGQDNSHAIVRNVDSVDFDYAVEEEALHDGAHTDEYGGGFASTPDLPSYGTEYLASYPTTTAGSESVLTTELTYLNHWLEENCNQTNTSIWFQAELLNTGSNTIYLYHGNPSEVDVEDSVSDEVGVFTYSSPAALYYVVNEETIGDDIDVGSYANSSTISIGGAQASLNEQGTTTFSSSSLSTGAALSSEGPLSIGTQLSTFGTPLNPVSFAGTKFVYHHTRYNPPKIGFYSPFGDARILVYNGSSSGSSVSLMSNDGNFTLSQGSFTNKSYVIPEGASSDDATDLGNSIIIESDLPILAHYIADNQDPFPMYPAQNELWGVPSNYVQVAAAENNTNVTFYYSNGTNTSTMLDAGETFYLGPDGAGGGAPALRIIANNSIGAYQQADGDASEASTFLPYSEFDKVFILPHAADYVAMVTKEPNTLCRLYDTSGTNTYNRSSDTNNAPAPNKIRFNGMTLGAGYKIVCNASAQAYFESSGEDAETLFLTPKHGRKYNPDISLGESYEEDRYVNLENNGNETIRGYLWMLVERWEGNAWQPKLPAVINDRGGTPTLRVLQAGDELNLTSIWNTAGGWSTSNNPTGVYRVYSELQDSSGNVLYDYAGNYFLSSYEFEIIKGTLNVSNITHENLYEHSVDEYEVGDTMDWINVTVQAVNNTLITPNITLSLIKADGSYAGFGPNAESQQCLNIQENDTCTKEWDNGSSGYSVGNVPAGTYTLYWNVTANGSNFDYTYNDTRNITIIKTDETFESAINTSRIYKTQAANYNFTFENQWSVNMTNANITLNCPSVQGFNCTVDGGASSTKAIGNVTATSTTNFTITVNSSTPDDNYALNVTLEYNNPDEKKTFTQVGALTLEVRTAGLLEITADTYPVNVTRGQSYDFKAYANNTGGTTAGDVSLNYSLPSGWTNSSGQTNKTTPSLASGSIFWNNVTLDLGQGANLGEQQVRIDSDSSNATGDFTLLTINVYSNTSIQEISANDTNASKQETVRLYATLKYQNGTAIPNQELNFTDSTDSYAIGTSYTNSSGIAFIDYSIPAGASSGTHSINISYEQNDSSYGLASYNNSFTLDIGEAPTINSISFNSSHIGYGQSVSITANVTDDDTVDNVTVTITLPNSTQLDYGMNDKGNDTYEYNTSSFWTNGTYNVVIWANDTTGSTVSNSSSFELNITAISVPVTQNETYLPNEDVLLEPCQNNWTYPDYLYRKQIDMTERAGVNMTDQLMYITLDTQTLLSEGKINSDGSDIRLYNITAEQEVPYLMTEFNTTETIIFFRVNISSGQTANDLYLYYDNDDASTPSYSTSGWFVYEGSFNRWDASQTDSEEGLVVIANYDSTSYVIGGGSISDSGTLSDAGDYYSYFELPSNPSVTPNFYTVESNKPVSVYLGAVQDTNPNSFTYALDALSQPTSKEFYFWGWQGSSTANTTVHATEGGNTTYSIYDISQSSYLTQDDTLTGISSSDFHATYPRVYHLTADKPVQAFLLMDDGYTGRDGIARIPSDNGTWNGTFFSFRNINLGTFIIVNPGDSTINYSVEGCDTSTGTLLANATQKITGTGDGAICNVTTNDSALVQLVHQTDGGYYVTSSDGSSVGTKFIYSTENDGTDGDHVMSVWVLFDDTTVTDNCTSTGISNDDEGGYYYSHTRTSGTCIISSDKPIILHSQIEASEPSYAWAMPETQLDWAKKPLLQISSEEKRGSGILNQGTTNFSGYVMLGIEKNVSGVWTRQAVQYNGSQEGNLSSLESSGACSAIHLAPLWTAWNPDGDTGDFRVFAYMVDPSEQTLNTTTSELIGYYYFTVEDSPLDLNVSQIRVYESSAHSGGTLTVSGTNKTFYLNTDQEYRFEIDVYVNASSQDWSMNASNVSYLDLNASWLINATTDAWYKNATDVSERLNGSFTGGTLKWNTSANAGTGSNGTTVTFYFIVNFTGASEETRQIEFKINAPNGVFRDYSSIALSAQDSTPPFLYSSTYGLNTTQVNRGGGLIVYARWNETINEAKAEYNSTLSDLFNQTISLPSPNNQNWTNKTLSVLSTWKLGSHAVKIYSKDPFNNWNNSLDYLNFNVYGLAYVKDMAVNDSTPNLNDKVLVSCEIEDDTNSSIISSYNVSFWEDGAYLDSNNTNSSGWANYVYTASTPGAHTLKCNITNTSLYNIDARNEETIGITTVETINPNYTTIQGPSLAHKGDTVYLNVSWHDNYNLAYATLSLNDSGFWVNYTQSLSGSADWGNFSHQVNTSMTPGVLAWKQYANDSSGNVNGSMSNQTIDIWGWATVSNADVSPSSIQENNNTLIQCKAFDSNSSTALSGYNMSFWRDNTYLGSNSTNSSGWAEYNFSVASAGVYTIKCNITDNASAMYNSSEDNEDTDSLTVAVGADLIPPFAINGTYELNTTNLYRGSCIKVSAQWNETVNVSWIEFNDTASGLIQQNLTGPFTGNWTNVTLCTNSTWLLGHHVAKLYARDNSSNLNDTLAYLDFYVWGKADVRWEEPVGTVSQGTNTIVCNVTENDTQAAIESYAVEFYNSTNYLGSNSTNSSGKAVYTMSFADQNEGTQEFYCSIDNKEPAYYNKSIVSASQELSIQNGPTIEGVLPSPGSSYTQTTNVEIKANVSDESGVDSVRANVSWDSTYEIMDMTDPETNGQYTVGFNTTTFVGIYNITILANDSNGNDNNETTWFQITKPSQLIVIDENSNLVNISTQVLRNESGLLQVEVVINDPSPIKKLIVNNHTQSSPYNTIKLNSPTSENEYLFESTYSIDLSEVNLTTANVTITAQGEYLLKCQNFSFEDQLCNDDSNYYTFMTGLTPGQNYSLILTANDPGFGETFQGPSNTSDAYIYASKTTSNYGASNDIQVGRDNKGALRGLIRFNLSSIPDDAKIENASLKLYFHQIPGSDSTSNRTHGVHRIQQSPARDWQELEATWNDYSSSNSWSSSGGDFNATATDTVNFNSSSLDSWIKFNVTYDTQNFIENPSNNYGWLIKDADDSISKIRRYYYSSNYGVDTSKRPQMSINYTLPDLSIESISFNNSSTPVESKVFQATVNVTELEGVDTTNVNVTLNISLWNGSAWELDESQEQQINVTGSSYYLTNFSWTAKPGTFSFNATVDSANTTTESNESNNNLQNNFTIGSWNIYYGQATGSLVISDSGGSNFTTWLPTEMDGNVYALDKDSSIDFSALKPLNGTDDFVEADEALNMSGFDDSVSALFDVDGNGGADSNSTFVVWGRSMTDVPTVNSINNSNFITGVLWDSGDGGSEYNGTQDLVFITEIEDDLVGAYGTYDYEMRVPAGLRSWKSGNELIEFYMELR